MITAIVVEGNKYVKTDAILKRIPYQQRGEFDPQFSGIAIKNLYATGQFRQITLEEEKVPGGVVLYVVVEEKKLLEKLTFTGNKSLKARHIKEKLNLDKVTTIDEEMVHKICQDVKKLYEEENRHFVEVSGVIEPSKENADKATVTFTVHEGPKSHIKFVYFEGNESMPESKLRSSIFTRENWLLSFTDSSGTYNSEMLDQDKHRIEYLYRDRGHLMAKVYKVDVQFLNKDHDIAVTFRIKEGPRFTVREVTFPGDEVHTAEELLALNALQPEEPYSHSKLVLTMNRIKDLYGESGYINAEVFPQTKPDEDSKLVDVVFHIDRGNKMYANRIVVAGNKSTRDKVIRRQLDIAEGDLITTRRMTRSQAAVEYLSFFEKDGVQWKIHQINDNLADLEMDIKEAKTGNFNVMLNYGSEQSSSRPSLRGGVVLEKSNLLGLGWDVGGMTQIDIGALTQGKGTNKKPNDDPSSVTDSRPILKKLEARFFDPHVFDSNVSAGIFVYRRWDDFEQFHGTDKTPEQRVSGGNVRFGFGLPKIDKRLQIVTDIGVERITNNRPVAVGVGKDVFSPVVERTFRQGTMGWVGLDLIKDTRNHQVYPTQGYKITASLRVTPPALSNAFSFFKQELEASYYKALIGDDALVLALHGKIGNVQGIKQTRPIPYKELFHMGGQSTVRGFVWGSIGPAWKTGDPLGARHAVLLNTELIFPLIPDYSMKGHVFYDAGAGWSTPSDGIADMGNIKRNKFTLRHAVGFGLNLLKPMPAKIDWGFKLDRKKSDGESAQEFHLSMNYAW